MKYIFAITDPGLDPDDIVCAWLLANAHKSHLANFVGAVANFSPALQRAKLLKGVFNQLNCSIPVAAGTDCNKDHKPGDYEFDFPLAQQNELVPDPLGLLKRSLDDFSGPQVSLLLISGLTDIAIAIEKYPDLLVRKLREVYIMGGASWSSDGRMIADPTASNNRFDPTLDPQSVYNFFLDNGIPLRVFTRHAAYAASITPQFYEDIADINVVGAHLKKIQRSAIFSLWQFANNNPPEHRQNRAWFCKTFCGTEGLGISADDSPWEYVKNLSIYDPLTAAWMMFPELFCPSTKEINGIEHQIVGLSPEESGILDKGVLLSRVKRLLVELG